MHRVRNDVASRPDNVDGLHSEGLLAVLRKHANDGVEHDFGLGEVGCGALDENVLRAQSNSRVVTVDDGRHGEYHSFGVSNYRVPGGAMSIRNTHARARANTRECEYCMKDNDAAPELAARYTGRTARAAVVGCKC